MLVTLAAPYADTSAADLSHALTAPEQPALHVLELTVPRGGPAAGGLRLRLLGASHQVVLDTPDGQLIETVACLPGQPADLPRAFVDAESGYRFTARVLRLDPAGMSTRVDALRHELGDDPYALVGVFPGGPDAVTALRARPKDAAGRIAWQTWHAYPQTGELVETETVVEVR